jgi:hypothetical protein
MTRPLVPEDAGIRKTTRRPSVYLARAMSAHVRAHVEKITPLGASKKMYSGDPVTETLIRRAASSGATTTGSGWADSLATLTIDDTLMQIASVSAGAALIDRGLKLNFAHHASIRVPGRLVDETDAGSWTVEGSPVMVRAQRITPGPTLTPHKLICITSYSAEMIRQSNIEAVSRALLTESMSLALDAAIFSTAAAGAAPAGILNNLTAQTPTTGGGVSAMATDIGNLMKALVAAHGGADPVLVMNPTQATTLSLMASPRFDIPILESTKLAPGTVILIEASSFVSAFDAVPEFQVSSVGTLQYESSTPADIVSGTGTMAVPVKSLYQTESIGLQVKLRGSWAMRRTDHVQYIVGCTW